MNSTKKTSLILTVVAAVLVLYIISSCQSSVNREKKASTSVTTAETPQQPVIDTMQANKPAFVAKKQRIATAPSVPVMTASKYTAYLASPAKGVIGLYNGVSTDNPADNIFSISVDRDLQPTDRVWLNYKLKGIQHHSGISCSVNDRYAFGGYLVKTDTATRRQRVEINPRWLTKGKNLIRFGMSADVQAGCVISELALEVEQGDGINRNLTVDGGRTLYDGKAYIHGFISGSKNGRVEVDGKPVALHDNEFEALIQPQSDSVIISATVQGNVYTKVIRYTQNPKADYARELQKTPDANSVLFGADKPNKLHSQLALLQAPAKTTISNCRLSVADIRTIDLPALDLGMTNVTSDNRGVRFLPHGQHFSGNGATVSLKYDRTKIPDGYTENDIRTYYFDPTTKHWVALERDTVDKTLCMVVSKTTHFTDMINGVITTPESPETQGFAPTMMNDIKAADPTSKIELIAPPTANNQGSANLSYPIELPPARNGMSPQLTITYNSDGGSGWLGEGWDLQIPTISVDTRWGVPRYDPNYETETYNMNGVMLATVVDTTLNDSLGIASVGHKGVLYQRLKGLNSEGVQFHPVTENDFSRITRLGIGTDNYYWKVITKSGLTITYGDKDKNATLEGTTSTFRYENINSSKKIKEPKNIIAEWKISSIEDQYGNFCHYYYDRNSYSIHESNVRAKGLRLSKIQIGRYKKPNTNDSDTIYQIIDFISNTPKFKFFTNARYGFLSANDSLLLNNINIKIINPNGSVDPVNGYSFVYKYGEFNSMLLDSIKQLDNAGSIKASHKIFYYNNIQNNDYYNPNEIINTTSVEDNTNNIVKATESNLPALGGSKSTSASGSIYIGGGVKFKLFNKGASADLGYNFSASSSESDGKIIMMDINGDGLPDKVYKGKYGNDEKLFFIPNTGNGQYGNYSILIEGYSGDFSFTKTLTFTNGWSGRVEAGVNKKINVTLDGGMDWLTSTSETKTYFSDVNSDGLIDIVSCGVVYFNSISSYQNNVGIPSFSTNSGITPRPVLNIKTPRKKVGELLLSDNFVSLPDPSQPDILTLTEPSDSPIKRDSFIVKEENEEFYKQIPMQDIVRVWEAPYPGRIGIYGEIKYLGNVLNPTADGVRLVIQTLGKEEWVDSIKPNDNILSKYVNKYLDVSAGQKVYFRLQSGRNNFCDGLEDIVVWSPEIVYASYDFNYPTNNRIGYSNSYYSNGHYNSNEASFVSQYYDNIVDSAMLDVPLTISGSFYKPITQDSVFLSIYLSTDSLLPRDSIALEIHTDTLTGLIDTSYVKYKLWEPNYFYQKEELWERKPFGTDSVRLDSYDTWTFPFECPMHLRFEISSKTNLQWENIKWKPTISFMHPRTERDTMLYAGVKYNIFEKKFNELQGVDTTYSGSGSINMSITLNTTRQINTTYTLVLSDCYNNKIKSFYGNITNSIGNKTFNIYNLTTKEYYWSLYINDTISSDNVIATCNFKNINITPYIYCLQDLSRTQFGHMWRGWGQFQYNAANGRYAKPIEEDSLFLPNDTSKQYLAENLKLEKMCMFTMNHKPYKNCDYWIGTNDHFLIKGDTICTGRLNIVEIPLVLSPEYDESLFSSNPNLIRRKSNASSSGLTGSKFELNEAPILSTKSKSYTWWGGATATFGVFDVGGNYSSSNGNMYVTSSYMDLNGDGFPDYITDTQVEFTNTNGGLDGEISEIWGDTTKSENKSYGFNGKYTHTFSIGSKNSKVNSSETTKNLAKDLDAKFGLNASYSENKTRQTSTYIDINGDGLPDQIFIKNGFVFIRLNQGYSFSSPINWGMTVVSLTRSRSVAVGSSLGASASQLMEIFTNKKLSGTDKLIKWLKKVNFGIDLGVNYVNSTNYNLFALFDINSDGLPDKVYKSPDNKTAVEFNIGNEFSPAVTIEEIEEFNKSISSATSANLGIKFSIPIPPICYVTFGASGNLGWSTDYTLNQMMDIDGDGYPDVVKANDNSGHLAELNVKRSLIGTTNKLKSVTNPLGGIFRIDYARSKASYDHPGGKWIMSAVMMNDGITDDGDSLKNRFAYYSGKYDRYEREFLGFGEVVTENVNTSVSSQTAYREMTQTFDNSNYYTRGALLSSVVKLVDGSTKKTYSESVNKYRPYSVLRMAHNSNTEKLGKYVLKTMNAETDFSHDNMFLHQYIVYSPAKYNSNKVYAYDNNNTQSSLITSESYTEYYTAAGTHGEVSLYMFSDKGNLSENGTGGFNYKTEINYLRNKPTMTLFSLPVSVTVTGGDDIVYRKTEAEWYDNFATQLKKVKQIIGNGDTSTVTMGYDQWGNICQKELPGITSAERMWYKYEYDSYYHLFPVKVSDRFGYTSTMSNYDYRFGIPCTTTDINGNISTTTLDNMGRISTITGPNEYNASYPNRHTIRFKYFPEKVTKFSNGTINNPAYAITWHYDSMYPTDSIVTVTFVDGFGRAVQVKKDAVVDGNNKMIVSGRVKYDAFGRAVQSYYPVEDDLSNRTVFKRTFDTYKTVNTYDVFDRVLTTTLPDNSTTTMVYRLDAANKLLVDTIIDALGRKQISYTNGSGQTVKTVQRPDSVPIITTFAYDAINQLTTVTDAANKQTLSVYDMAGRRTQVTHPASGITRFGYDVTGNLLWKLTANKDTIKYGYDYNRLKTITYPRHSENNVTYTYGSATDDSGYNRKGRLVKLEDGSGVQEFKYGKMGEITELRRTLVIPNQAVATYVTKWQYDSWNRLLNMTYPDGETLFYSYNKGGSLFHVVGYGVNDEATAYINNITYDKFEQRTQLDYGNGSSTFYTYNPANRQLSNLRVYDEGNNMIMRNTYQYDAVSNVIQITNEGVAISTGTGSIGGSITHNYSYDKLYRLKSANGTFTGGSGKTASYTLAMKYDDMHNIISKEQTIDQANMQFTGNLSAGYKLSYKYAGNRQQIANIADQSYRHIPDVESKVWNNRQQAYSYDANGNLIMVATGTMQPDSTILATNTRRLLWDEENRLLGINDNGFVSNYWYDAAGERTVKESFDNEGVQVNGVQSAGRTGTSKFTAYVSPYMVVSNGGNYTKHIYVGSQRITSKVSNSGIFTASPVKDTLQAKYATLTTKIKERFDSLGVAYNGTQQTGGLVSSSPSTSVSSYFYHSDHLGSSSLITDDGGNLVQHIEYVPFGETFIDERNGSWHTPYLFNAKEQDEETGLHYYGARYYDSRTSVWISVDPLAEDYMNVGSYVYCHDNPITLVDPTGMGDDIFIYQFTEKNKTFTVTERIYTGEDTPNRLFVQDKNASKNTKNRLEHNGRFYEQKMIPISAYEDKDFENNHPFSNLGFGDSQFDKDRIDYINHSGKYNDTNLFEREWESLNDEGLGYKALDIVVTLATRKSSVGKLVNGLKKSSKGMPHGDNGRALKSAEKKIQEYENQMQGASRKERERIQQKINNILRDANKKKKGETHWN